MYIFRLLVKIILAQPSKIGWMEDDTVNSFTNLELRKTDMESYLFGQEGNLWNNIIFKVDVIIIVVVIVEQCYLQGGRDLHEQLQRRLVSGDEKVLQLHQFDCSQTVGD